MGHFSVDRKGPSFVDLTGVDLTLGLGLGLQLVVGLPLFLPCMLGINI